MGRWLELAHKATGHVRIGILPDNLWRRYIEIHMVTYMEDRYLSTSEMAWLLHVHEPDLQQDLLALFRRGIDIHAELQAYFKERAEYRAWLELREQILERDGFTCRYCGAPADSVDHIIPRSRKGADDPDNLVAACRTCNSSKGARTPEEAGMELVDD